MSAVGHDLGAGVSGRRFLIHACLGRGGFGEVYRATMTSAAGVRTEVAVKILRADIDPGSDSVKRLRDEGRLLGILSHPSILRVHDLVLLQRRVALVTEFVEGEDLDSCLAADPPLPIRPLVQVLGEVAAALDVAWNAPSPQGGPMNLVHRDVKPANIRLGRHGEVKLLDFGIARATNLDREAQTANNAMLGSYLYMAPERFHEEKVEPPSDVYALGCILFEGLTRHRLFEGMTLKQIYGVMLLSRKFNSHVEDRLKLIPADTVPGVAALLRSLLEVDPGSRPSASQVARQCEDLAETLQGPTLKRWARNREWPHQPQIVGSLDGRDLSAESFDVSEVAPTPMNPSSRLVERTPASYERSTPERIPPVRPLDPPPESLSLAGLLALPVPGENALDAPIAGLVSREMARPTPQEIAEIRSTEPPIRGVAPSQGVRLGQVHEPPVARPPRVPAADPPAPPRVPLQSALAPTLDLDPPASARASAPRPRQAGELRAGDTAIAEEWFSEGGPALDVTPDSAEGHHEPTPGPTPPTAPALARAPLPRITSKTRSRPRIDIPIELTDETVDTDPLAGGEVPDVIEPIPGVFDDEVGAKWERGASAQMRQLESERRQRWALWGVMGMAIIGLAALGALGWWVQGQLTTRLPVEAVRTDGRGQDGGFDPAGTQPVVAPVPAAQAEVAVPVPVVEPVPPVEPVAAIPLPEPAPVPEPPAPKQSTPARPTPAKPPPKPAPAPKVAPSAAAAPAPAAAPKNADAEQLAERGWARVDSDPGAALALFDQVVAATPKSAEGYYGRGYALMQLGRKDEAVGALCTARTYGSRDIVRDIDGVLKAKKLGCPP